MLLDDQIRNQIKELVNSGERNRKKILLQVIKDPQLLKILNLYMLRTSFSEIVEHTATGLGEVEAAINYIDEVNRCIDSTIQLKYRQDFKNENKLKTSGKSILENIDESKQREILGKYKDLYINGKITKMKLTRDLPYLMDLVSKQNSNFNDTIFLSKVLQSLGKLDDAEKIINRGLLNNELSEQDRAILNIRRTKIVKEKYKKKIYELHRQENDYEAIVKYMEDHLSKEDIEIIDKNFIKRTINSSNRFKKDIDREKE